MIKKAKLDLFNTVVEQEAYDLAGQLVLPPNQVRCHVIDSGNGSYTVRVDSPEAWGRAVRVASEFMDEKKLKTAKIVKSEPLFGGSIRGMAQ